jgi:hypothetical protein
MQILGKTGNGALRKRHEMKMAMVYSFVNSHLPTWGGGLAYGAGGGRMKNATCFTKGKAYWIFAAQGEKRLLVERFMLVGIGCCDSMFLCRVH